MKQLCPISHTEFEISEQESERLAMISPKINGKTYPLPLPTHHPRIRAQQRLAFRNEYNLYRGTCALSGKPIISIFDPARGLTVYEQKIRRSDARDPLEYGIPFDSSKTINAHLKTLNYTVPKYNLINLHSENSDYCNICAYNKDSYLLIESSNNEDCYYSYWLQECTDMIDCMYCSGSQQCYASDNLTNCFKLFYSKSCESSQDCSYCVRCTSCHHCYLCDGLENESYCIRNQKVSKEEYESLINTITQEEKNIFFETHIKPYEHYMRQSENCTGNYIRESKNCQHCYHSHDGEDNIYCVHARRGCIGNYDCDTVGLDSQYNYNSINTAIGSKSNISCSRCRTVSNSMYCIDCDSSSFLFGCNGLRNKQYCIFNTQYTKEQYEALLPTIIEHMIATGERGKFFDPSVSVFAYNETIASLHFPLSESEALAQGYLRQSSQKSSAGLEGAVQASSIPSIQEVDDSILQQTLLCSQSGKAYRINKGELAFYKKFHINIPTLHPEIRHNKRLQTRSYEELYA